MSLLKQAPTRRSASTAAVARTVGRARTRAVAATNHRSGAATRRPVAGVVLNEWTGRRREDSDPF